MGSQRRTGNDCFSFKCDMKKQPKVGDPTLGIALEAIAKLPASEKSMILAFFAEPACWLVLFRRDHTRKSRLVGTVVRGSKRAILAGK